MNFQNTSTVHKIWYTSDFFQRSTTLEREITRTRKKRVQHEISKSWHARFIRYGMHVMNRWTDNLKPICTININFFEVEGIINTNYLCPCRGANLLFHLKFFRFSKQILNNLEECLYNKQFSSPSERRYI